MYNGHLVLNKMAGTNKGGILSLASSIGLKNLVISNTSKFTQFQFKGGATNKANRARIRLNQTGKYDVVLYRMNRHEELVKGIFLDVDIDSIKGIFQQKTGFYF